MGDNCCPTNPCFPDFRDPVPKRCPPGNKAERTKPIIPNRGTLQLSNLQTIWRTTYQNDFIVRQGDKPKVMGPPSTPWRTEIQFYKDSVYKSEFKPFLCRPFEAKNWNHEKEYSPPCQPLNGQSSYNRDYPPKQGCPALTAKKRFTLDPNPLPMDDLSTYKVAYVIHPRQERPLKKSDAELLEEMSSVCTPFDGLTIYKKDYLPNNKPCPSKNMRPGPTTGKGDGKFDDRTIYRGAYEPFYYDDGQYEDCIQAEVYDNLFPKKDKCADVRCFPEEERILPPHQRPTPPCPPAVQPTECPRHNFDC